VSARRLVVAARGRGDAPGARPEQGVPSPYYRDEAGDVHVLL
jgi:hypothetical protein